MIVNQNAITGMGGLGKTQLVVQFAYCYGRYFRGVHWFNLADPTLLDSEIAHCGLEMAGFAPNWPEDQPSQVALTLNTWKSDGPRLLVLDNFEDVDKINNILPRLRHSSLRLLITSRRTNWPRTSGLSTFQLELFAPEESLAFLKNSLENRKDKEEELATLAERLGHLPLALELASRYLNGHPRLSVDDYRVQAKEAFDHPSMRDWRKDLPAPTQHDLDLQRTFALSWESVNEEIAQKMFLMAGYLAPNTPILPEIFEKALEISGEACDEALNTLYGLGLLRKSENDQPTVHPLLAEYARALAEENREILEKLADVLGTLSKQAIDTGLPFQVIPLRPHLPITASHAEEANVQDAGTLWNNYGYHLWMIADYAGARAAYKRALKIDEANFGLDHPNVAIRVNNIGLLLKSLGDFKGARVAYQRAIKIWETKLGVDHPQVALGVNNLGSVLQDLGDLKAARTAYKRALKIDESTFGPDHPDVARDVNNLGDVLRELGDLNGARTAFERVIKIWETNLGPDHPLVSTGVNNLGSVLQDLGDLNGARTMFERALKIEETALGLDHPSVAIRVNNLGLVLDELGDLNGARAAYERALKILKKFLPPEHPDIKTVQENLDSLNDS